MTKEYKENPTFGDANFEYKERMYFGMPEEEYHNIPFFSRSMAETMNIDAEEAWYKSPLNPDKPENNPTSAMQLGTAIHSVLLEPDIFNKIYVKYPCYADYPGTQILNTTEDLKNFLVSVGEKKTGVKADLIDRVRPWLKPDSHTQIIWDDVVANFKIDAEKHGKRILKQEDAELLDNIKESLERRPEAKELLRGGYSEVVIIWRDKWTDELCKCRLDFIKINSIIDVKSFSFKGKTSIKEYLRKEIIYQQYNMQYAVYIDALETIIKKIRNKEAEVFGEVNQEWLNKFLENENKGFSILFVRTQAPYQIKVIPLRKKIKEGGADNITHLYYTQGRELFTQALIQYQRYKEEFGDKRWMDNKVEMLIDDHVPQAQYQVKL